jgi:hypothetical protein
LSISSAKGSSHFQEAMKMLQESHPKIALALKSSKFIGLDLRNVLLSDNQSTFNLCCNKKCVGLVSVGRSRARISKIPMGRWIGRTTHNGARIRKIPTDRLTDRQIGSTKYSQGLVRLGNRFLKRRGRE